MGRPAVDGRVSQWEVLRYGRSDFSSPLLGCALQATSAQFEAFPNGYQSLVGNTGVLVGLHSLYLFLFYSIPLYNCVLPPVPTIALSLNALSVRFPSLPVSPWLRMNPCLAVYRYHFLHATPFKVHRSRCIHSHI